MMMMMMDDDSLAGAFSPVVFFDGEREIDLGTIVITPAMTFHAFRSIISQKIGISYHQLTIYFERTTSPHHRHHHRRHPVTSKFNFSAAMGESSFAFFRVVLKRSSRLRRRRLRNLTLEAQYMDYAARLREEMEREKERYLMSLNLNSDLYSDLSSSYYWGGINGGGFRMSSDDGASSSGCTSSDRVLCDVCLNYSTMESETVPFHWCKNDAVTLAFRSHAGPIGPPSKTQRLNHIRITPLRPTKPLLLQTCLQAPIATVTLAPLRPHTPTQPATTPTVERPHSNSAGNNTNRGEAMGAASIQAEARGRGINNGGRGQGNVGQRNNSQSQQGQ